MERLHLLQYFFGKAFYYFIGRFAIIAIFSQVQFSSLWCKHPVWIKRIGLLIQCEFYIPVIVILDPHQVAAICFNELHCCFGCRCFVMMQVDENKSGVIVFDDPEFDMGGTDGVLQSGRSIFNLFPFCAGNEKEQE